MSVYRIKGDVRSYFALGLNSLELAQQIDRMDALATLVNFPSMNAPLADIWRHVSTSFMKESKTASSRPDLMVWSAGALYLSERAHEALKEYINKEGEFLAIEVDGAQGYIFNCLEFAPEDSDYTVSRYCDGEVVGLAHLEFKQADISTRLLFKSQREGCGTLFCTDTFKDLCDSNGLHGLIFDKQLMNPFI